MKKVLAIAALLLLPVTGAFGQTAAQSNVGFLLAQGSTYGSFTCPAAATSPCFVQYGSAVPVTPSTTPGTPLEVDITKTGGVTQLRGTGATGTGSERVTVAVDSATVAGSATLPAGTNVIGHVVTDSTSVTAATPTPSATVGLSVQSCTVACASTIVSGAHALYSGEFSATVAGWLLIYDATSCPVNGTVTPEKTIAYPVANQTTGFAWSGIGIVNATGIAACFSTTGPYTATASTTAFISVDYK